MARLSSSFMRASARASQSELDTPPENPALAARLGRADDARFGRAVSRGEAGRPSRGI